MDLIDYCLYFLENETELLFVWLCLMKMRRHMETKRFLTITIETDVWSLMIFSFHLPCSS